MKETRESWFPDLEEEYLEALASARDYFEATKAEFERASKYLGEAEAELARIRAKYPPDYKGPAPWF